MALLFFDPYAQLRLVDFIVPFLGAYRPLWLGLGTLAFDVLAVVIVTSLLRHRLGVRTFRVVALGQLWLVADSDGARARERHRRGPRVVSAVRRMLRGSRCAVHWCGGCTPTSPSTPEREHPGAHDGILRLLRRQTVLGSSNINDGSARCPSRRERHLVAQLDESGLTGRGGAGFPTGRKFASITGRKAVVIGNGAEGEPLSHKDARTAFPRTAPRTRRAEGSLLRQFLRTRWSCTSRPGRSARSRQRCASDDRRRWIDTGSPSSRPPTDSSPARSQR